MIGAGIALAFTLWSTNADLEQPPLWAWLITAAYLGGVLAAALRFAWASARALAAPGAEPFGKDGVWVAQIITLGAIGWSARGLYILLTGGALAAALAWSDPRGRWSTSADGAVLRVAGEITPYLAARIRDELIAEPAISALQIDSGGGLVSAGDAIARMVRARDLDVLVRRSCSSACLTVLLAGQRRIVTPRARIGCHQQADLLTGASVGVSRAYAELRPPARARDVYTALVARCDATPPADIYFATLGELAAIGAATHVARDRAMIEPALDYCAGRAPACLRRPR